MSSISFQNAAEEEIVVFTYHPHDTLQAIANTRTHIKARVELTIPLVTPMGEPLRVHICRLGLFDLTSLRTRLTSGMGFLLTAGGCYRVALNPPDENGNLCNLKKVDILAGTTTAIRSPAAYTFGDKLLRPMLKLAAGVGSKILFPTLALDDNVFEDHMATRISRSRTPIGTVSPVAEPTLPPLPCTLPAPVHIPDREIWGVFFEQTFHAGHWAYHVRNFISEDDLELQEPYLFIGLPAVALYNTVMRSLSDPDGLVFIDGRRVVKDTCPENFHLMFDLLIETKNHLNSIERLNDNELLWVQQFLLFAGSDKQIQGEEEIAETRKDELRHSFSYLVAVSTQLTQQACYKINFVKVLNALLTEDAQLNDLVVTA